jgi:hypothetical protein
MFAEYIQAALERAEYEMIGNPDPYYAHRLRIEDAVA